MPITFLPKKNPPKIIEIPDDAYSDPLLERDRSLLSTFNTPLEYIRLKDLKPNSRSAKKHPERQIALLTENVRLFGFTQPLAVDGNNVIVLGNARYEAARREKLEYVPAIRLLHLSATQKRALALADNKLSELGEWDLPIVAEELQFLSDPALDLGFDLQLLGFDTVEIDNILEVENRRKQLIRPIPPSPMFPGRLSQNLVTSGSRTITGFCVVMHATSTTTAR